MNLEECFKAFDGDLNEALGRMITEERVKKFLRLFLKDDSFQSLCDSMNNSDYETAFRAAHTLKGVSANLGIENVRKSASDITEALRGGVNNGADAILARVAEDYRIAVGAIEKLD